MRTETWAAARSMSLTRRQFLTSSLGAAAAPLLYVSGSPAAINVAGSNEQALDPHEFEAEVDTLIRQIGITATQPGVAVLVIVAGHVALMKGYGLASLRNQGPITPWTRFELASVSKTFTSTAVLMLQERGLLSIDDDVRKYLPELPRYESRPLRISDMLHHISGLPVYFDLENVPMRNKTYWVSEDYPAEFARQQHRFPLKFPIGQKYEYNNTNYMLMAVVIERVARKPFGRFMRDEIFTRAGMPNTFVYSSPASVPRNSGPCNNALGYQPKGSGWDESWGTAPDRFEKNLEVGDGAVWSNLRDLANWDAAIRADKLVKADTMKLAFTPSKTRDGKTNNYGLGWSLDIDRAGKLLSISHGGDWGGFETSYYNSVAESFTVVLLSNRGKKIDINKLSDKLRGVICTRIRT
jgi:CubicO group peptidase (beta-lactamase class C family)